MASPQHGLANRHEIRDRVISIADELPTVDPRSRTGSIREPKLTSCKLLAIKA